MKKDYLDLLETVFDAYTDEHIRNYTNEVIEKGVWEHGFPRLTANLGVLLAHGRKLRLKDIFIEMMDLCCCNGMHTATLKYGCNSGHEFSVKEIILCILELEKSDVIDKKIINKWRSSLSEINPLKAYNSIAPIPPEYMGNWPAFGVFSEQMRVYTGLGNESDFIENQIASLLFGFDESGMFRDPDEPMVYDFVTRLQIAGALYFGYNGKYKDILYSHMMNAADITLLMQSSDGEIPYGGRSNQFLHNETFYAALCEYYAQEFKKQGNMSKASEFKYAAKCAIDYVIPWFTDEHKTHIKNYYPIDSNYGCEIYAYYDKYMITSASWLFMAYIFSDDTIPLPDVVDKKKYIFCTPEPFHKVFCRFGDYFTETDTCADMHYDASGIGRIHKKGVPSSLCISSPFPQNSTYTLDIQNPSPLAICAGVTSDGETLYAYDPDTTYQLVEKEVYDDCLFTKFTCTLKNGLSFNKTCTLSDSGVEIVIDGNENLELLFPVFDFDGMEHTEIQLSGKELILKYHGHECKFTASELISDKNEVYANRNGHYKKFAVSGKNKLSLKIEMK